MKGPISKDSAKWLWLGWLESGSLFCGALVVLGLALESSPEIVNLLKHHVPLPRPLWGDALVTIGVFGEVSIGLFIARSAKRQEIESAIQIAELNSEIERLRNETAEANLARAKIEQRMKPRVLDETEVKGLVDLLAPYHKTRVEIIVFDAHLAEPLIFSDQLRSLFVSAGFASVRHWEAREGTHRIAGSSVIIAVAKGHEDEFRELANALARALRALDIECGVGLGVFGCAGPNEQGLTKAYEFRPPQYQLRFEKPRQFMGIRAVSAFRVEVGAKQLTAIPTVRPGVTGRA